MKIYLISQNVNKFYDTYDSFLVCAENEDEAKDIHPGGYKINWGDRGDSTWVNSKSDLICEEIGDAKEGIKKNEVIIASFNAG